MSQPTTTRPPQVTLAGTVVIAASVLVLLSVWDRLATLRSLESRERIENFLGSTGKGLGLDLEGVLEILHVAALVSAGCAAATAILGWFVLRRDTASRLVLSILAVPLFLSGLMVSDFWSSFVAASAAMLWLSPAREWFATGSWTPPQPRQQQQRQTQALGDQGRPSAWPPAASGGSTSADPQHPDAQQSDPQHAAPPPQGTPYGSTIAPAYAQAPVQPHPWGPVPQERPRSVVTAAVLAIVMSGIVGAVAILLLAVVGMAPESLQGEMERQQPELSSSGITFDQLRPVLLLALTFYLTLCALALVFAGYLLAGREWARRGLMVTAGASLAICFLGAFAAPSVLVALPALLPAVASMAAFTLLRRPESRSWCQGSDAARRR